MTKPTTIKKKIKKNKKLYMYIKTLENPQSNSCLRNQNYWKKKKVLTF